jgi:hypothetical protein
MLESGTGIFQLQKIMGHKNLKTTLRYLHLTEENTKRGPRKTCFVGKRKSPKKNGVVCEQQMT